MKVIFSIFLLFPFISVFSQAVVDFNAKMHDFGKIKEADGIVSCQFEFVNQGSSPVLIKNVESSCGCTSPEWTRQPVLPGKKGFVKAVFNPKDRPGYFDKTITVYSNAQPAVIELKIRGNVEGKTRTILDDYPYELASGLRLPLQEMSLMKVRKGEIKFMRIGIFNNAGKDVEVNFAGLPDYLKMSIDPALIEDKGVASVEVAYNTTLHGDYGLNRLWVEWVVNGKKYPLPVSVFIEEDFRNVDMSTAPVIEADKKYYNFGTSPAAQAVKFTYQLKNKGKTALKIHRIYTNDVRVAAEMKVREVQPNETACIEVRTKEGAEPGKVAAVVSVITNSPLMPELKLRFYGELK